MRYNAVPMESPLPALRRHALFASLSDGALASVARAVIRRSYAAGEMIIFEGDPAEAVYFIAGGQVRAYRLSAGGREQVLAQLGPGQAFNTVPAFQPNGTNHATVETLTSASMLIVGRDDFRRLVAEHGELAMAVVRDFADRLDHLTNLVEDLSLRTVRGRVARFLLENADVGSVTRAWTQEEMATRLGTVRDVVGRTLRGMADAGLIRLDRQRIVLLDRSGLEAEVQQ